MDIRAAGGAFGGGGNRGWRHVDGTAGFLQPYAVTFLDSQTAKGQKSGSVFRAPF